MPGRDTKESGTSCWRKDSVKQAVIEIERPVRFLCDPQMCVIHTIKDKGDELLAGCRDVERSKGGGSEVWRVPFFLME